MFRRLFSIIVLSSLIFGCAKFDAVKKSQSAEKPATVEEKPVAIPTQLVGGGKGGGEGESKDKVTKPPDDPDPLTYYNFEKFLNVEIIPTDFVKKYLVKFNWKKPSEPLGLFVSFKKASFAGEERVYLEEKTELSNEVLHNQKVSYTFYLTKFNPTVGRSFVKEIEIPKDYIVTNDNNKLTESLVLDVNRFFMLGKVKLTTNGHEVKIKTNVLYAENAIIETFPEGKTSETGDGRSGGKIELVANEGIGNLDIQMRGENGKKGNPGENSFPPVADGARPDYRWQIFYNTQNKKINELDDKKNRCTWWRTEKHRNVWGDIDQWWSHWTCCIPIDGTDARKGENGKPGGNGFAGGDSGDLIEIIIDRSKFTINHQLFPSKGGPGGEGAPGQQGGRAMVPVTGPNSTCINGQSKYSCPWRLNNEDGNYDEYNTCYGVIGKNGDNGNPGGPGDVGAAGKEGIYTNKRKEENK